MLLDDITYLNLEHLKTEVSMQYYRLNISY